FPTAYGRKNAHVTGENNKVDLLLIANLDQAIVIRISSGVADGEPRDVELFGDPSASISIADHGSCLSTNVALANCAEDRPWRFRAEGDADCQSGEAIANFRRPRAN